MEHKIAETNARIDVVTMHRLLYWTVFLTMVL